MGELQVTRWRKYGKDRLYVNDENGARVGWVDLATGYATVELPDRAQEFHAAVAAFRGAGTAHCDQQPPQPTATSQDATVAEAMAAPQLARAESNPPTSALDRAVTSVGLPTEPDWLDLASNRPGQAAREQAERELAAMKERSRVGTFLARAFDMKTDERSWRVGAGGEETVGAKLDKLTKHGWHVLHAVPVGDRGSDIDHVLIGPGGVYTVNTKTHPGKSIWVGRNSIRVDGRRVPYLRNSRFEADRAATLLSAAAGFPVLVRPALVFLTGTLIPDVTIKQAPDDVLILDRMDLPGAFKRASRKLSDEQVAAVFEQARRSTTWQPDSASR